MFYDEQLQGGPHVSFHVVDDVIHYQYGHAVTIVHRGSGSHVVPGSFRFFEEVVADWRKDVAVGGGRFRDRYAPNVELAIERLLGAYVEPGFPGVTVREEGIIRTAYHQHYRGVH